MKNSLHWLRNWWAEMYAIKDEGASAVEWFSSQCQFLKAGKEIEPPWKVFPDCAFMDLGPLWGGWRQGSSEGWIKIVWYPFWGGLSKEDHIAYLAKWEAPESWRLYLEPDAESSLGDAEKASMAGHVLNLWLMDIEPNPIEADDREEKLETE